MKTKPNFLEAWKLAIAISLTAIGELIMIDITKLPIELQWLYLVSGILLLFLSLALVQSASFGLKMFVDWKNAPKIKNIRLSQEHLPDGRLALQLINKEFIEPEMWISRLQIANNPLSWFPISAAGFSIKSGESRNIFFVKWDKEHRYFVIEDFQENIYKKKVFGVGEYNFNITLRYGFSKIANNNIFLEMGENNRTVRFSARISLNENGVIEVIKIKPSD
jgi:hypothetical protein